MTEKIKIRESWIQDAKVNKDDYALLYNKSINNNEEFWKDQAKRIVWLNLFQKLKMSNIALMMLLLNGTMMEA